MPDRLGWNITRIADVPSVVSVGVIARSLCAFGVAACLVGASTPRAAAASRAAVPYANPVTGDTNYPAFVREPLPGGNMITYAVIDPATIDLFAAAASGAGCVDDGVGSRCTDQVSAMVNKTHAAGGMGANLTDYITPLGLVVIDHQVIAKGNPNTTSFCIGDRPAKGRTPVSITATATAAACRTVVSGEGLVLDGKPSIQGRADAGHRGKFWWSVKPAAAVERQLVAVLADGRVIIAVATSQHAGQRGGMSLDTAAAFLIAHHAVAAIALDGGHLANLSEAVVGPIVPAESQGGPQPVKVCLLFRPRVWTFTLAGPPPPPPAPVVRTVPRGIPLKRF